MKYFILVCFLSSQVFGQNSIPSDAELKQMVENMKRDLQGDMKSASECGKLARKHCSGMSIDQCMAKKAKKFPEICRNQFAEVQGMQKGLMGELKPCMDMAKAKCPLPQDIDPSKGMAGLKKYQACYFQAMSSDARCSKLIEDKVNAMTNDKAGAPQQSGPFKTKIK